MRVMLFVTIALLGGCSTSLDAVSSMRDQAPEWYEARKVEFRGEGYPRIDAIPVLEAAFNPTGRLAVSETETRAALEMFNTDPRAELAIETPAAIVAWAEQARRAVEGQLPAPDFLTDSDVEALKARFDVARAKL